MARPACFSSCLPTVGPTTCTLRNGERVAVVRAGARRSICWRPDVERGLVGLLRQADQHLVDSPGYVVVLDAGILDAGRVHGLADLRRCRAAAVNCTCTSVPPRKSTPSGTGLPMCAQCMPIEIMPATLKINEKPRKYHFFPSQSTFTLRNSSTGSLPSWERSKLLAGSSAHCFPAPLKLPLPGLSSLPELPKSKPSRPASACSGGPRR